MDQKFRTVAGLRGDFFRGDVASDNTANSGKASDHLVNPKLSLIFGPWAKTEYYINWGRGFHSNDVRGTTITVAPTTGAPASKVPLLVRTSGYEVGFRSELIPRLETSFTVYQLDFESELLFLGDAGTTEASRPSKRVGFEWTNHYTPTPWLLIDADIAFARARFSNLDPVGNRIWFAGEAAHERHWGTVRGAWDSGERAAAAVLRTFAPPGQRLRPKQPRRQRPR